MLYGIRVTPAARIRSPDDLIIMWARGGAIEDRVPALPREPTGMTILGIDPGATGSGATIEEVLVDSVREPTRANSTGGGSCAQRCRRPR